MRRLILVASVVSVACTSEPASQGGRSSTTPGERRISSTDYGNAWPFTVTDGLLSCEGPGQAVYFRVGSVKYAVNGMAKGHGNPDVEAIWKTRTVSPPKDIVKRISESRRRDIFKAETGCPRQAEDAAQRAFPDASTPSQLKASAAYEQKIRTKCKQQTRATDKLTEKELDLIDAEGYALHWPPTSPARAVSIGPIIDDGLKLCRR